MIQIQFLKQIYYRGRIYKKGRKLNIDALDAEAMIKRGRAIEVKQAEEPKKPVKRKKKSITIKKYNK